MTGSIILLVMILGGVALLWLGWWLLFSADPSSVIHSRTGANADAWSRAYFTGFTLFTLGVGDYVPNGPGWQLATALASFNGLFLITLSIAYLLPALSAATQKRQLGAMIRDLGHDSSSILTESWDGRGFDLLMRKFLVTLSPMIHLHAQRHLEYPIIHYFHSNRADTSLVIGIAVLDEAFTMIAHGVSPEARPHRWELAQARRVIGALLDMLESRFIPHAEEAPPAPTTDRIATAGIPVAAADELDLAVKNLAERRRLRAYVEDAGWTWQDVLDPQPRPGTNHPPTK